VRAGGGGGGTTPKKPGISPVNKAKSPVVSTLLCLFSFGTASPRASFSGAGQGPSCGGNGSARLVFGCCPLKGDGLDGTRFFYHFRTQMKKKIKKTLKMDQKMKKKKTSPIQNKSCYGNGNKSSSESLSAPRA